MISINSCHTVPETIEIESLFMRSLHLYSQDCIVSFALSRYLRGDTAESAFHVLQHVITLLFVTRLFDWERFLCRCENSDIPCFLLAYYL